MMMSSRVRHVLALSAVGALALTLQGSIGSPANADHETNGDFFSVATTGDPVELHGSNGKHCNDISNKANPAVLSGPVTLKLTDSPDVGIFEPTAYGYAGSVSAIPFTMSTAIGSTFVLPTSGFVCGDAVRGAIHLTLSGQFDSQTFTDDFTITLSAVD